MKNKLILDNHILPNTGVVVYGLKLPHGILLPKRAANTRWNFAHCRQTEIIIELAKRLQNGYVVNGNFAIKSISKINQCSRIMKYYHDK